MREKEELAVNEYGRGVSPTYIAKFSAVMIGKRGDAETKLQSQIDVVKLLIRINQGCDRFWRKRNITPLKWNR